MMMALRSEMVKGTIVYSRNSTTGFHFVGVVLEDMGYRDFAKIQFSSSYDGVQNWSQASDPEHLTVIGQIPEWAEWDCCEPW